jgi:hypothetical protein
MIVISCTIFTVIHPGRFARDTRESTTKGSKSQNQSSNVEFGHELYRDTEYTQWPDRRNIGLPDTRYPRSMEGQRGHRYSHSEEGRRGMRHSLSLGDRSGVRCSHSAIGRCPRDSHSSHPRQRTRHSHSRRRSHSTHVRRDLKQWYR